MCKIFLKVIFWMSLCCQEVLYLEDDSSLWTDSWESWTSGAYSNLEGYGWNWPVLNLKMAQNDTKHMHRTDSRFNPSQWEMALFCNDITHWLGASLESALYAYFFGWTLCASEALSAVTMIVKWMIVQRISIQSSYLNINRIISVSSTRADCSNVVPLIEPEIMF